MAEISTTSNALIQKENSIPHHHQTTGSISIKEAAQGTLVACQGKESTPGIHQEFSLKMSSKTVQGLALLFVLLQLEGVLGDCVERQEFDKLKQELYSWQNTTIHILNKYLLEEHCGDRCACTDMRDPELHQKLENHSSEVEMRNLELCHKLDQLEEAGNNHSREVEILHQTLNRLEEAGNNHSSEVEMRNLELCHKLDRLEEAGSNHSREVNERFTQLESHLDSIVELLSQNIPPNDGHTPNCSCGSLANPATSCRSIDPRCPSGRYWIQSTRNRNATQVYCDMTRQCCGSRGGWMKVAHLDMTDPNQHCPPGFRLITSHRRVCGRPTRSRGCASTTFPVHGVEYQKVCGRIIGYQYNSSHAFRAYYINRQLTIDDVYVDGVSITHGSSPRKHIWTFAAAANETMPDSDVCPCTRPDLTYTGVVLPFIGQDYFCETGSPLWDGMGCGSHAICCSFNNPPWFCKELPQPTTDDIELRLCSDQIISNEDTPIELVELYVQ